MEWEEQGVGEEIAGSFPFSTTGIAKYGQSFLRPAHCAAPLLNVCAQHYTHMQRQM
ncbi:hypothetical protein NQZ68_008689 [Dissostichus eleginoides]|nr:hypothetical protein NQZ68_008689 [Dissostichus eleginoides]